MKTVAYALIERYGLVLVARRFIVPNEDKTKIPPQNIGWILPRSVTENRGHVASVFVSDIKKETGLDIVVKDVLGSSQGQSGIALFISCYQLLKDQNPKTTSRFHPAYIQFADLFEKYLPKKKGACYLAPENVKQWCRTRPSSSVLLSC